MNFFAMPAATPDQRHAGRLAVALLAIPLLSFLLSAGIARAAAPTPIRITILPCTEVIKTFTIFQPLTSYLKKKLNREIHLRIPESKEEFSRIVRQGETEFAYQSPQAYLALADQYDRQHLLTALTPTGSPTHHGVFVVRQGSDITKLTDLRDRAVLFGHNFSAAKWMAATALLKGNGINIDRDLSRYTHGGSCESIALHVYLGQSDAGVICDYSLKEMQEATATRDDQIPPNGLVAIAATAELPNWVFAPLPGVDPKTVAAVSAALRNLDKNLPEHRQILEKFEAGGFVTAHDHDYDGLRRQLSAP